MMRIYALLALYYVIGLVAILVINRRRSRKEANALKTKYGVYLLITLGLVSALAYASWVALALAIGIAAAGGFELGRLPGFSLTGKTGLLMGYAALAFLFCTFLGRSAIVVLPCQIYLVVLSFDGFSQIVGQLIGGPKLAPGISPGKTWSGFLGGLGMGIATGFYLEMDLALALAACLLAFLGDMLASAIKRRAGVKDYSTLIPGHGGILDRFDSFLFAGAILECYFRFA